VVRRPHSCLPAGNTLARGPVSTVGARVAYRRGASARAVLVCSLLGLLGVIIPPASASASAEPEITIYQPSVSLRNSVPAPVIAEPAIFIDPANVTIGNGPQQTNGTYLNAEKIANNLVFTSITVQASGEITIAEPSDLSKSLDGTPQFNIALVTNTLNINAGLNLAAAGYLVITANTLNINAQIMSGGTTLAPSRVIGTATQANVLSNAASIQQAIDLSSTTAPVTVQVSSGQYAENLTISNSNLTLTSNVGTQPEGADPEAALLIGIKSGGSLIDVTAKNVTISGIRLHGDGTTPSAVHGIYAKGGNELTVNHNTFAGFSGPAIETPESTNVTLNANAFTPTLLATAVTPVTPAVVAVGGNEQMTDTGTYSEGPTQNVTDEATWSSSEPAVATVNAAGLAHAVGLGTTTITAKVGTLSSSATLSVVGPPTATVNAPAEGQTYGLNQTAPTNFSCADATGALGIASCVDSNGATTGTGSLNTAATGTFVYTVTATSLDGQTGTATIHYAVGEAGQCRLLNKGTTPKIKHGAYSDPKCEVFYEKKAKIEPKGSYEWYPGTAASCIATVKGEYSNSTCTTPSVKAHKGTYERQPCYPECAIETEYRRPPT
jgi:hypothetical protein